MKHFEKIVLIIVVIAMIVFRVYKANAMPVAMQKMICYPIDVSIVNSYDKEEIMKKAAVVYTNEKSKSDITLYRCETNNEMHEICYMKIQNNIPTVMSCFKGF